VVLENGYFKLEAQGPRVTSLQIDPTGRGDYGQEWVTGLGFAGAKPTEKARVRRVGSALRITGLVATRTEHVEVRRGGFAEQVSPGHTIGQSFEVPGTFDRVEAFLATWRTKDSDATLTLRRDGPEGEVVARRRIVDARDNSWQSLSFEPQGPGRYYLELGEVDGVVGWWGKSGGRSYRAGQGYRDGKPLDKIERAIRLQTEVSVGQVAEEYELDGPRLHWRARVEPQQGRPARPASLVMQVRWDNEGYDVSAKAVPFFRFYSDSMRYMAVQQLKRWKERAGRYEHDMQGRRWIRADGTENYDLVFRGRDVKLVWWLHGKSTDLIFTAAGEPTSSGKARLTEMTIEARPRKDELPGEWPRFVMPSQEEAREANVFYYERAFSYGPIWGPAAWHEWNALSRLWQGGGGIDAVASNLATYPISPEGYVHTWGGRPGWPFPDNSRYDTRHFDTNARFILACWRYACWTGDRDFLVKQAERLRRAMNYQLTTLHGLDGLIVAASKDVTGRHMGIGNNYWDILPFGHLDAYANAVWYASLEAMAQIEEMLAEAGGAKTKTPARSPDFYRKLAARARAEYNRVFWDDEKGRYIGCVDVDGVRHDYGFTFVNLEAMAYGLASEEQARRIYHWMETEPTSSGKCDTYTKWIFAPRANTLHNPQWRPDEGSIEEVPQPPWWMFGWRGTPYGDQCQDGGAILYTSFFDLMARQRFLGPDNAWARWEAILGRWRLPDHLCGGPPLYRGENPQQIAPGSVGVDVPFPESSLVPCWLLYGVMGVQPTNRGLEIAPRLPSALPWLEIKNVAYHGLLLDLRADRQEVTVSCSVPGYEFTWRKALPASGKVVFTEPPPPVKFPATPVWKAQSQWHARWVWAHDPEAPKAYLRLTFTLPAPPVKAWLAITGDDSFTLYANGQRVVTGDNWHKIYRVDLTPRLRKGKNVLGVAGVNDGGPGAVIAQGEVVLPGGQMIPFATSSHWRVAQTPADGWQSSDFDDSQWGAATEYGQPPCGPWGEMETPAPPAGRDRSLLHK